MSLYGGNPLPRVREVEERLIRADYDRVAIASGTHSGTRVHAAVRDDAGQYGPLCVVEGTAEYTGSDTDGPTPFIDRPKSVFPLGFREFCSQCAKTWRDQQGEP